MRFELRRVHFMPNALEPGILYVSEEFHTAAHLCACGCGTKVRTPLGPTEWSVEDALEGPSLWPSIGNWQRPCQSHYWIDRGDVVWGSAWSKDWIESGRRADEARRNTYFERRQLSGWRRVWRRLTRLF